jgi:peptidoglycan/xylan/chitin deacetylase (PgdA/CDA1 family)
MRYFLKAVTLALALGAACPGCREAFSRQDASAPPAVIRINALGYTPGGIKVAVWAAGAGPVPRRFSLVSAAGGAAVFTGSLKKDFGPYGPFAHSFRLDFTAFSRPGRYYLRAGQARSPLFAISDTIYKGTADFCLQYLRQQRSGFNPYLRDSCHTHDGFTLYGPMPDGTHVEVWGGWHDASDYLQYVTTSATADYYLLAAWRDFPRVFTDSCAANGLPGKNGIPDVLDEARWGLDWLLKMHPRPDWMFNQIADDRDHAGFRLPDRDSVNYGHGLERPVYFCSGAPQGLGKYTNHTTGAASTAGKFTSCFALGAMLLKHSDPAYARKLAAHALTAYRFGLKSPGYCQTAPDVSPYYYTEQDWQDDMELGAAMLWRMTGNRRYLRDALRDAAADPLKPWEGADTATHYQWYPFYNAGHDELARHLQGKQKAELCGYYRQGIRAVWEKARRNAFYRGIPFIWCSNNLTAAFAIQCYLYRRLTGDTTYRRLEQACVDWLFGCNPWGTTMVVGLPAWADNPSDPYSALSHLYGYPINGGMVDGPVYGSIYGSLIGVHLSRPDSYAPFQSRMAVYHDDWADYSTNEPTTDGTATLLYLLASLDAGARFSPGRHVVYSHGAIIAGDTAKKQIALVFTGHRFDDGGPAIAAALEKKHVRASFFLTGQFYRSHPRLIRRLQRDGDYLGSHSNSHPLYCDWTKRDSLLVTRAAYVRDLDSAYRTMRAFGISPSTARYYLPAYEWYNDSIAAWTRQMGLQLVCFTPGTYSNADYSYPQMGEKYLSSAAILGRIFRYERSAPHGLNGFILLMHIGTDPRRTDKLYFSLGDLIDSLNKKGYRFVKIGEMLGGKQAP